MAAGTWKLRFRFTVNKVSDDTALVDFNPTYASYVGLNQAVSMALSFIRRNQAIAIDAYARVYGKPIGANATTPLLALAAPYSDEQEYARLDAPDYSLKRAISLANREVSAEAASLTSDLPEDITTIT